MTKKHGHVSKKKPDHRDATLVLRLYALRREAVMRESRNAINLWLPRSWDEFVAITQPAHPQNPAFRQVSSYWEMAYGFARHRIMNADFLAENAAEGLLLYVKIEPHLERFRREVSPTAFRNASWLVENSAVAAQRLGLFKKRVQAMLEAAK